MNSDRILTINEYYDGPRLGIAELNGVPHIYEAEFDHSSDEYGDTYFLSPIAPDLLALVIEDWEIYLRREEARQKKEVALETHPALPQDQARHESLKLEIGDRLRADPENRIYLRAKFGDGENVRWISPFRFQTSDMRPNETIVKEGSFLYAGEVECDIRIVHSPIRYGTGDDEDPPEIANDMKADAYYVWYGSTTERGQFKSGSRSYASLADAMNGTAKVPGIGDTLRWL